MRALVEAAGSPVWGPLMPFLRKASSHIVSLDISPLSCGLYSADKGYVVPKYGSSTLWPVINDICRKNRIDTIFPSINEGLKEWADRKDLLQKKGINVVISSPETISICTDKWKTFLFFKSIGIPSPRTSLKAEYQLIKPRTGRGGNGIKLINPEESRTISMQGMISQDYLKGQEYSVDVLCNAKGKAICIVIRERLAIESGVSTKGRVINNTEIENAIRHIIDKLPFFGPIDIQCFKTEKGIFFTEINPRMAGGLSLSMAATANWFKLVADMLKGRKVGEVHTKHGLIMLRCYQDVILHERNLVKNKNRSRRI